MLYFILFLIGINNAIPVSWASSTLTIWLTELGFSKEMIGTYALIGIPFSFKIFWNPIIDHLNLPFFANSPRKNWLIFALVGMAATFFFISFITPRLQPELLAIALFSLFLFSSCLYIVGIAYELESLKSEEYGIGSFYILSGYRCGLLIAGSGLLFLSSIVEWSTSIQMLGGLVLIAALIIGCQPEPFKSSSVLEKKRVEFANHSNLFSGFWHETIQKPCELFFQQSNWMMILFLILTFKVGDQMAKVMEGPFYLSLGFTKPELATASKLWGMAAALTGAYLAGRWLKKQNSARPLVIAGVIHASSLICYYLMAIAGKSLLLLYLTTAINHFTSGAAITIFICFLWKNCHTIFASIQYALLWSLFMLKGDLLAFLGGILASQLSWPTFFLVVTFLGVTTALLGYMAFIYQERRDSSQLFSN